MSETAENNHYILDACCGSRMFWFDRKNPLCLYVDNRTMKDEVIWRSANGENVRFCSVQPDIVSDFRNLPFRNGTFWHVVFDPPHLIKGGDNAWLIKKYGKLPEDWKPYIREGFSECWRVLHPYGTLIFKWSERDIPVKEVLSVIDHEPLYGHKSGKQSNTHWLAFFKEPEN